MKSSRLSDAREIFRLVENRLLIDHAATEGTLKTALFIALPLK